MTNDIREILLTEKELAARWQSLAHKLHGIILEKGIPVNVQLLQAS